MTADEAYKATIGRQVILEQDYLESVFQNIQDSIRIGDFVRRISIPDLVFSFVRSELVSRGFRVKPCGPDIDTSWSRDPVYTISWLKETK